MAASKGSKSAGAAKKTAGKSPIHIKKSHEGSLHTALGVPQGQPIPEAKLQQALNSKDPKLRAKAQFAKNAKGFNHRKKGS